MIMDWYIEGCEWLTCYKFHNLGKPEQDALLVSPEMIAVVDDIWNMFGNILPVQIPRYFMGTY
jgi:hypothetical protein